MKAIDFDKLFEKFVKKYVAENKNKYSAEDWENHIGEVYEAFSSTEFSELGGKTPQNYFKGESGLIEVLRQYVENDYAIVDELLDEIAVSESDENLLALLDENESEEMLFIAIDIYRKRAGELPFNRYIDLLFSKKLDNHVKNEIVEDILPFADRVEDIILAKTEGKKVNSMFAEILSYTTSKNPKVKKILLNGLDDIKKVAEYSAYLVHFGDESCLPQMLKRLSEIDDFVAYRELKNTIDALGGVVDNEKDFSFDEDYLYVKKHELVDDEDNV